MTRQHVRVKSTGTPLELLHLGVLLMHYRFREVSEIHVEDETRECTFRVTIRHGTGAEETFESREKAMMADIACRTYVEAHVTNIIALIPLHQIHRRHASGKDVL